MNKRSNGKSDATLRDRMKSGEIDEYQFALIEQTGLIAVRRPDGDMRMLPGAADVEAAVRQFIAQDTGKNDD